MSPSPPPARKPINFVWGKPAPSLLPVSGLAEAFQIVLGQPEAATDALEYGDTAGPPALRREVARWLSGFYETPNTAQEICITAGSSQGLAVELQVLSDPLRTRRVWCVAPCFHLASRVFEDAGLTGRLRAVPETDGGVDLDFLEREMLRVVSEGLENADTTKPADPTRRIYEQLIYVVPTFSNPSGRTIPLAQRHRLVALARRFDALIISDDIYDHLPCSPDAAPLPRLVDIDRATPGQTAFGHTLSNGSFSKMIGPGVRTGWISATPALAHALANAGASVAGGCPSQLGSAVVAEFMASGRLDSHVRDVLLPAYARRRALMDGAIRDLLCPLGARVVEDWEGREGGFYIWLRLPGFLDGGLVAARCSESEALSVWPGNAFEVAGDVRGELGPYLRLCYSWEDEDNIREGIGRLARVVQDLTRDRTHENVEGVGHDWRNVLWKSNTATA